MREIITLALVLGASTPALADEYYAVTPSGATEAIFSGSAEATSAVLANKCMDARWAVTASTPNQVICEIPMGMGQSVLAQALIGNSYSTPPKQLVRFSIAGIGENSRVQATGWIETQMAFGQMRQQPLAGPPFHNGVMAFFEAAGGRMPPGTTWPNHAYFGFRPRQNALPKIVVDTVEPGAPAERGGLQPGDEVARIAGKRVSNWDQIADALAKANDRATFPVEIVRAGTRMTLTLPRDHRPPAQ